MDYEIVIGLEVHIQLSTRTKVFCGCSTDFGKEPNTQVCPVCLGLPGVLPVLNQTALDYSIIVGLALNCTISEFSRFDRKHYYYPDLPKNYQISQYEYPLCQNGFLDININDQPKRIRIRRVHLEEDAGKLLHQESISLIDYNRTGMPLLEIVTEPDISSPDEAYEYLLLLKSIIKYLGVSDCDMEKGSLRCDANISVRRFGEKELGTKTELKNMNSFKAVKDALSYEANRQIDLLRQGLSVVQETRLWNPEQEITVAMRSKEEAKDYRYFPEPDLPPLYFKQEYIQKLKNRIPELPDKKYRRFLTEYNLRPMDAQVLVAERDDAEYAEQCLQRFKGKDRRIVINWLIGPLSSEANERKLRICQLNVSVEGFLNLLELIEQGRLSQLAAKQVLKEMINTGKGAQEIIKSRDLEQISDTTYLESVVAEVVASNPKTCQDYQQGKENALMFLVGQVMKKTKGKANPQLVQELLRNKLTN